MKCIVTGGNGFLGSYIVQQLLQRGDEVISVARSNQVELEKAGVKVLKGDIQDAQFLEKAFQGADAVFHTAARAAIWGNWDLFYGINVLGTQNVINACLKKKVPKLVYTSSPSVIFGEDDLENVDEKIPYPEKYLAFYPQTKAIAEQMVIKQNGQGGLLTCSLRPHLIFGPGDNHLIPRVIEKAKKGKLKIVGSGNNLVDIVYVENAAKAHLLAVDRLVEDSPVCGSNYFISQGKPVNLWNWVNDLLEKLGIPKVKKNVSYEKAFIAGKLFEKSYKLLGLKGEPPMTRFVSSQLAKSHYFNISKAQEELNYTNLISTEEALQKTLHALRSK
ncbi:MAG: NAD-dependent epimerase/dehydratase family protein [Nitrospinae bacterium]|nr:NAD-dependent epimerase/dehydratase family protein [Nitrospinota bacterium]